MTRVLLVGGGGREHAIALALRSAQPAPKIFALPGNPGLAECAICLPASTGGQAFADVLGAVTEHRIDLLVIGPEAPLVAGIVDALKAACPRVRVVGPRQAAARLEASKRFTRELAEQVGIPGARFVAIEAGPGADIEALAQQAMGQFDAVPVVKADGLAAGKGVFLPDDHQGCIRAAVALLSGDLGAAGTTVVVEERLEGAEASLFYACNGTVALALPHARDHKRLLDGDKGPNTGGMGAISPNPDLHAADEERVRAEIVAPVLQFLADRGTPFHGFLFVGVMLTAAGPRLIEFNVRLGDPEAQTILPRLAPGDFLRLCWAMGADDSAELQALADQGLRFTADHVCAVVLAAEGYPAAPVKGVALSIDRQELAERGAWVVHAGTREQAQASTLQTAGGRVVAVVGRGPRAEAAIDAAYNALPAVHFAGQQYRHDIGRCGK